VELVQLVPGVSEDLFHPLTDVPSTSYLENKAIVGVEEAIIEGV
jgi:hypothetical protein